MYISNPTACQPVRVETKPDATTNTQKQAKPMAMGEKNRERSETKRREEKRRETEKRGASQQDTGERVGSKLC